MHKTSLLTATFLVVATAASAASAETQMTLPQLTNPSPVKADTLKFEPFKGEIAKREVAARPIKVASRPLPLLTGRSAYRDNGGPHTRLQAGTRFGPGSGYAALVGDENSGLGFYPLPERYRAGADRYRWSHAYWGAPGYYPYGNPVQQAVRADSLRYATWTPPSSAVDGYRYGVFDPVDGVGTPFFAGYYGGGGRSMGDGAGPRFGALSIPLN